MPSTSLDQLLGRCYGAAVLNKEPLTAAMAALTDWLAATDASDDDRTATAAQRVSDASAAAARAASLKDRDFISKKNAEFLTSALGAS